MIFSLALSLIAILSLEFFLIILWFIFCFLIDICQSNKISLSNTIFGEIYLKLKETALWYTTIVYLCIKVFCICSLFYSLKVFTYTFFLRESKFNSEIHIILEHILVYSMNYSLLLCCYSKWRLFFVLVRILSLKFYFMNHNFSIFLFPRFPKILSNFLLIIRCYLRFW